MQLNSYLHRCIPHLPALDNDIRELVQVTRTYSQAAPSIVQALNDFTVVNQTLVPAGGQPQRAVQHADPVQPAISRVPEPEQGQHHPAVARQLATLQILARYSPEFPCVARGPGQVRARTSTRCSARAPTSPGCTSRRHSPSRSGRTASGPTWPARTPRSYGDNPGPHCYPIPFNGITLNDGATPATPRPARAPRARPARPRQRARRRSTSLDRRLSLAGTPAGERAGQGADRAGARPRPAPCPAGAACCVGPLFRGSAAVNTATDSRHCKRKSLAGPLIKSIIFIAVTALATALLGHQHRPHRGRRHGRLPAPCSPTSPG